MEAPLDRSLLKAAPTAARVPAHERKRNYDVPLPDAPADAITQIDFGWRNEKNFVVASSWDSTVRIWELTQAEFNQKKITPEHKETMKMDAPILCCAWSEDGNNIFTGGGDKLGLVWDAAMLDEPGREFAHHAGPIQCIQQVPERSWVATGAWDKTVRFWDLHTPSYQVELRLPENCMALDVTYPYVHVASGQLEILIFDLRKVKALEHSSALVKHTQSPLGHQTRCIRGFPNLGGSVISSVEGQVCIQHFERHLANHNYAFNCHRDGWYIYPVNDIAFHPQHPGTFATCGGDGSFSFWDKDSRAKLRGFPSRGHPLTSCAFNRAGDMFVYSVSFDWNQDEDGGKDEAFKSPPLDTNSVFVKYVDRDEVRPLARDTSGKAKQGLLGGGS